MDGIQKGKAIIENDAETFERRAISLVTTYYKDLRINYTASAEELAHTFILDNGDFQWALSESWRFVGNTSGGSVAKF